MMYITDDVMRVFPFRGLAAAASRSGPWVSSSSGIPCSDSPSETLAIAVFGPVASDSEVIATRLVRTESEVDRREEPTAVAVPKVSERGRAEGTPAPEASHELVLRPLNLLFFELSLSVAISVINDVV